MTRLQTLLTAGAFLCNAVQAHAGDVASEVVDQPLVTLSEEEVQGKLTEWGLDQAFGSEFREARVDGLALSHMAGRNFKKLENDADRYPSAQFFHFLKLKEKLDTYAQPEREVASTSRARTARRQRKRRLELAEDAAGVHVARDSGYVALGADADVTLARTGDAELTIDADTEVSGSLSVDGDFSVGGDTYPFFPTFEQEAGVLLDVKVRSRGYDDACLDDEWTDLMDNACDSVIIVNDQVWSLDRGHTIVYFDDVTGELGGEGYWDTHETDYEADIIEFVNNIPEGNIVVMGVDDSAGNYEPTQDLANLLAYAAAEELELELRDSLCLIGRRGANKAGANLPWQQIVAHEQYDGPSDCSALIQTGSYKAEVSGAFEIVSSDLTWNGNSLGQSVWVRVKATGFDDPGYADGDRSRFYVNGALQDVAIERGHNFLVINEVTGVVEDFAVFDTHGDGEAGDNIEQFVGNVTTGRIVALAVHDAGGNYEHPETLLGLMAGHEFDADFELRESFCLIGRKGKTSVPWMVSYWNAQYNGPSSCEASIPLVPPAIADALNDVYEGDHVFSR